MTSSASTLSSRFQNIAPFLNERQRRIWAGNEAKALGHGGISLVAAATGLARATISQGMQEVGQVAPDIAPERVRRPGAGRKKAVVCDPGLKPALDALIEPATRGDPESALRWVSKSTAHLAQTLTAAGHPVSANTVSALLHEMDYSLQANKKTDEGKQSPDRNAQFEYLAAEVADFQARGQPVISVDAKKKELIGNYKNNGQEWHPEGAPKTVKVYDFIGELGRATPYGVYDLKYNEAWVSVGTDHDTAEFAVESIRVWWENMGKKRYPDAKELLITSDGGGSNGSRNRLWKRELGALATELGIAITVSHLPPGTSKWNKIEHRLFSFISMNWRGTPLVSYEVIISLIGSTTTASGLKVGCDQDPEPYEVGIKVTDAEMAALKLRRHTFHGEWNYTLDPQND